MPAGMSATAEWTNRQQYFAERKRPARFAVPSRRAGQKRRDPKRGRRHGWRHGGPSAANCQIAGPGRPGGGQRWADHRQQLCGLVPAVARRGKRAGLAGFAQSTGHGARPGGRIAARTIANGRRIPSTETIRDQLLMPLAQVQVWVQEELARQENSEQPGAARPRSGSGKLFRAGAPILRKTRERAVSGFATIVFSGSHWLAPAWPRWWRWRPRWYGRGAAARRNAGCGSAAHC